MEETTPIGHSDLDIKLIFEVKSNKNNTYTIILIGDISGEITIEGEKKGDLFHIKFSSKSNFEEIKSKYKHFINFEFKDIFDAIKEIYDNDHNKIKLIENENNLIFSILLKNDKEISYILNKEKNIFYDEINELKNLISNLQIENEQFKKQLNEIQNNQNEQNNQNNELDIVKNEINEIKNNLSQAIKDINNHNKELQEIKDNHNKEIKEIKEAIENHKNELKEIKDNHKKEINEIKNNFNQELNQIKNKNLNDIKQIEIFSKELNEIKNKHNQDINQIINKHNQDINQMTNKHNQDINLVTNKHNQDIKEIENKHNQDINLITNNHLNDIKQIENNLKEIENKYNQDINQIKNNIPNEINDINNSLNVFRNDFNTKINNCNMQSNAISYNLTNKINQINNYFNNEIVGLNNRMNIIQNNDIKELKKQVNTILDYINNKDLKNGFIIGNNNNYFNSLKLWISPNKSLKSSLLYRLTRDGDQISKFHELCDNKGATLTLFKVQDGNIGGIFTPLSWDCNSGWKGDMNTFMFNLNQNRMFKKTNNAYSIYCDIRNGPFTYMFGFFQNNQMRKIQSGGMKISQYFDHGSEILPNNNQNIQFYNVKEVEVYQITIE